MWLESSNRRIFFDMHFPDWEGKEIASRFNPKEIAETFANSNVDSVVVYAKCQYGNFYYDTQIGHKHSGLGDMDLLNELKNECHRKGIKVIAYYSVSWDELIASTHPEWMVKKSDGTYDTDEFRWKTLCINSPYKKIVFDHIKEIMDLAKPDGFWVDMTIIGKDRCHCDYCNSKFKEKYGYDIPKDSNDIDYNTFMQFRYDYIEEFYGELRSLIKKEDKEIMITNNYWGYPYSTATMGSRAVGSIQHTDFVTGEAYTDWTGLNAPSFFSKFLRGVANDRPYEALIGRFYNTWDYTAKPYEQLAFEVYSAAANGACVTIDDEPYHDGKIDYELYQDIGKVYSEIKQREQFLGGNPIKYAAILHSQLTKDYYSNYGDEAFIKSIAGSFKMLRDLHYPIEFIFDEYEDILDLSKYKVVILPSVAAVTNNIMSKLKIFVESGGTLVMSGVCALYRVENYKLIRDNSLLEDNFGIKVHGEGEYSLSYIKNSIQSRVSLVKGKYMKYEEVDNEEAIVVEPICETSKETFFHNNLPSPYKHTNNPALFVKKIGQGNIVCFAQPIFAHYSKQSQVDLRKLFNDTLRRNASSPIVEYECPNRIDVAVWEKEGDTIVHILNPNPAMSVCCGHLDPFDGAYPRTFEYMDEIIPVYNIKIIINSAIKGEIESVGEKNNIKVDKCGGKTIITLDKVDIWETLRIR